MTSLRIHIEDNQPDRADRPTPTIRSLLDSTSHRVRAACQGTGQCGLCRIRIDAGEATPPTTAEQTHLTAEELRDGIRLACQSVPLGPMEVTLLAPAGPSHWRTLTPEECPLHFRGTPDRLPVERAAPSPETPLGLAIDLGTTHLCLTLCDLRTGQRRSTRRAINPQAAFGSDIMSRLQAAASSPASARELRTLVHQGIAAGLADMAARDGYPVSWIQRATLVGNTAMLALLSGRQYRVLLDAAAWHEPLDCLPKDTRATGQAWGLARGTVIEVIPPLAGFVGSDLLATLGATQLTAHREPAMAIDFGTNTEIALWDGTTLWVTSCAGGPAFETCTLGRSMADARTAIHRINDEDLDLAPNDSPLAQRGIRGSGLVDLLAHLRRQGILDTRGRHAGHQRHEDIVFSFRGETFTLSRRDIDALQRAKAAVGVGLQTLLDSAHVEPSELARVCVGGAFGRGLDVANAVAIGLLPDVRPDGVKTCGNTALAGAESALLSTRVSRQIRGLVRRARLIALGASDRFEDDFLRNLFLEPLASGAMATV